MKGTTTKPVIFMAFANEAGHRHLSNLAQEADDLNKALETAEKAGLCDVIIKENATVEEIFDTFQDVRYRDRIAIFHFGGHADGYQLLLSSNTEGNEIAYGGGLVSFLGKQDNLKLIFLNGCQTQQQALDMVKEGVPCVIGTTDSIADSVALSLSARFYQALGEGTAIQKAWAEAQAHLQTRHSDDEFRALRRNKKKPEAGFSWEMHVAEGAEDVRSWSLTKASNNPLFGLPDIPPTFDLPEEPFRFLHWYEREHAEVFFGRSHAIREIFARVTNPEGHPVIRFFGMAGAGKSSLLDAGLLPRLEEAYTVFYLRRVRSLGLLGSLLKGLGAPDSEEEETQLETPLQSARRKTKQKLKLAREVLPIFDQELQKKLKIEIQALQDKLSIEEDSFFSSNKEENLLEQTWKLIEATYNKPLVVILDQVEEAITHPNPEFEDELGELFTEIKGLFHHQPDRPKGKLILSYRKEYDPEIRQALTGLSIVSDQYFLTQLEEDDIVEVVHGLSSTQRLQEHYNVNIDESLGMTIAHDLRSDPDSPIAPILQILMTKLWGMNTQLDAKQFSEQFFSELREKGLWMNDFFRHQMDSLHTWNASLEDSGLALDLLNFHTTELGTAATCTHESIEEHYDHHNELIDDLLTHLKGLYLIINTPDGTHLAHDTLAPIVKSRFRSSEKPGPRASRILEAKMYEYRGNEKNLLGREELKILDRGAVGMRSLTPEEKKMIDKSRAKVQREEKKITRFSQGLFIMFLTVVLFSLLGIRKWNKNEQRKNDIAARGILSDNELEKETSQEDAIKLTAEAYRMFKVKPLEAVVQLYERAQDSIAETKRSAGLNFGYYRNTRTRSVFFNPGIPKEAYLMNGPNEFLYWDLDADTLRDPVSLAATEIPDSGRYYTIPTLLQAGDYPTLCVDQDSGRQKEFVDVTTWSDESSPTLTSPYGILPRHVLKIQLDTTFWSGLRTLLNPRMNAKTWQSLKNKLLETLPETPAYQLAERSLAEHLIEYSLKGIQESLVLHYSNEQSTKHAMLEPFEGSEAYWKLLRKYSKHPLTADFKKKARKFLMLTGSLDISLLVSTPAISPFPVALRRQDLALLKSHLLEKGDAPFQAAATLLYSKYEKDTTYLLTSMDSIVQRLPNQVTPYFIQGTPNYLWVDSNFAYLGTLEEPRYANFEHEVAIQRHHTFHQGKYILTLDIHGDARVWKHEDSELYSLKHNFRLSDDEGDGIADLFISEDGDWLVAFSHLGTLIWRADDQLVLEWVDNFPELSSQVKSYYGLGNVEDYIMGGVDEFDYKFIAIFLLWFSLSTLGLLMVDEMAELFTKEQFAFIGSNVLGFGLVFLFILLWLDPAAIYGERKVIMGVSVSLGLFTLVFSGIRVFLLQRRGNKAGVILYGTALLVLLVFFYLGIIQSTGEGERWGLFRNAVIFSGLMLSLTGIRNLAFHFYYQDKKGWFVFFFVSLLLFTLVTFSVLVFAFHLEETMGDEVWKIEKVFLELKRTVLP